MTQGQVSKLQSLTDELEELSVETELSRDFFEIIEQETYKDSPNADEAQIAYKRLHILNGVYFRRVHEENIRLQALFNKFHNIVA